MKESAQAALSYARGTDEDGSMRELFETTDVHVHVPAGSIPKDGPSAGITIATALVSLLSGRPVDRRLAMTGEITLRGDVLAIGGIKEKVLAAREAGIRTLLLPGRNRRDFAELGEHLTARLEVHFVDHMSEVLEHALRPGRKGRARR